MNSQIIKVKKNKILFKVILKMFKFLKKKSMINNHKNHHNLKDNKNQYNSNNN